MGNQEIQHSDAELIDLIYAALLGESSWQHFLDRLSDNAPDGRTILFSMNTREPEDYVGMTSKFSLAELKSYSAHYINTNPWLEHCAVRKIGLGVFSDQIVPWQQLIKTEFFNDWLSPNNIACSIGVTIDKYADCPLIISTVTSRADPEANSQFSEQLSRIAPHLRRAARFYRNSPAKWTGFDIGGSMLDSMDIGVVLVGEDRRIKTISKTGREFLDGGVLTSISPLGQLRLCNDDAQAALQHMLKRTYAGPKVVTMYSDATKLTLIAIEKDRVSFYFEGPTVALLIEKPGNRKNSTDLDRFAAVYKLTRGERRALAGIINGKTITQIGEDAGVSRETIRTQLKGLYTKTETGSQTRLLRLVHWFWSNQAGVEPPPSAS
ncbi:LuxR C-terminal-related transcriptional regulator [Rhizobium pusense]|uniref:helix-turn-helix transcriptional regulator n=1 Tax=Agrobacterium pusense TaxID=648995 RepID=UPI000D1AB48D|nr:LuxR C-terminal-related transcriptional regulator [Agrobacterium pusense]MDH0910482.1 LuxR C-terminal-related transcriptional regulator [Agrobacterium pusense]MDH1098403.1 LuxR C-terminal-related transcriptional regulator [Agrobacterium pusense]MDH1114513.1 LuxR C-terminal-related transcriptional regulator [Agrobacterium pusense]MDH2195723.1 LuxR C-terminal-related transcriptional regulator [Agrobacterium pusense]